MKKSVVDESLNLLGLSATDRVTGFTGMVASISFDAYGCVQAILNPPMRDGKLGEQFWFDVKRLQLGDRVMPVPNYTIEFGKEQGGDALPVARSLPAPQG